MKYQLLTGATGLLGSYLLRELLVRDHPVAVVVRPTRFETAAERIDNLLAYWEGRWKRWLPRPVVLSGDINQPGLGLSASQERWVQLNCRSVLHSAASLAFEKEGDEPWRTNVDGLQNVLDFCDEHALREFWHISSCYVCGLRSGVVLETELNSGQRFGNVYEKSKVAGEELVRNASHLDSYSVFRPSIIIGDTDTGFSSTFHGFYTPLRLLSALAAYVPHDVLFSENHMENIGLQGNEGKNLVPVQWLSDAIVTLMDRNRSSGKTYALAAVDPVPVGQMVRVFEQAIRECGPICEQPSGHAAESGLHAPEIQASIHTYMQSFAVYQSYWRDDPTFDMTNTMELIPDKRPPQLSDADLLTLCKYALENQFSLRPTRQHADTVLARDRFETILHGSESRVESTACSDPVAETSVKDPQSSLTIVITGLGGGAWTVFQRGMELHCEEGRSDSTPQARLNSTTFRELVEGDRSVQDTLDEGRMLLADHPTAMELFRAALSHLAID